MTDERLGQERAQLVKMTRLHILCPPPPPRACALSGRGPRRPAGDTVAKIALGGEAPGVCEPWRATARPPLGPVRRGGSAGLPSPPPQLSQVAGSPRSPRFRARASMPGCLLQSPQPELRQLPRTLPTRSEETTLASLHSLLSPEGPHKLPEATEERPSPRAPTEQPLCPLSNFVFSKSDRGITKYAGAFWSDS